MAIVVLYQRYISSKSIRTPQLSWRYPKNENERAEKQKRMATMSKDLLWVIGWLPVVRMARFGYGICTNERQLQFWMRTYQSSGLWTIQRKKISSCQQVGTRQSQHGIHDRGKRGTRPRFWKRWRALAFFRRAKAFKRAARQLGYDYGTPRQAEKSQKSRKRAPKPRSSSKSFYTATGRI